MQKTDVPLFTFLVLATAVGFLGSKGYEPYMSKYDLGQYEVAAVAKAVNPTQKVVPSDKSTNALSEYIEAEKISATETTLSGRIEGYFSESKSFESGDQPLKFVFIAGRDSYDLKNLSGELPAHIDGASVTLSGALVQKSGAKKELLVNLSEKELGRIKGEKYSPKNGTAELESALNCNTAFCALVVPINMTGESFGLPTPEELHSHIFAGPIKNALAEESYGQVIYAGTVTEWVNVTPQTLNVFSAPYEVAQYFSENNINPAQYEQIVFLVNGGTQSYGGEASIGSTYFYISGSNIYIPVALVGFGTYQYNNNLTSSNGNLSHFDYLYVHETGHNMNALHDNLLNCKSGPASLPSECIHVEYGNKYSIMGDGAYGGHFSFFQKLRAGWINSSSITFSSNGAFSLNALELPSPSFLGIDGNSNQVPEFLIERRSHTGLDELNAFTSINLQGGFLYRMKNTSSPYVTSDPLTWEVSLVDTTPAVSSHGWFNGLEDAVLRIPQQIVDAANRTRFGQSPEGQNNLISVSPHTVTINPCRENPIKVYEPYINPGDKFAGQLGPHKWPLKSISMSTIPTEVQNINADVNDPSAEIFLHKNIMVFNDDYPACGAGQYQFEFIYNGQSIPLLTESVATYLPWSGPLYNQIMALLPVYGETYGSKTLTLKITKLNDGTVYSRDLMFNLVQ